MFGHGNVITTKPTLTGPRHDNAKGLENSNNNDSNGPVESLSVNVGSIPCLVEVHGDSHPNRGGAAMTRSLVPADNGSLNASGWLVLCKLYEETFKEEGMTQVEFLRSKESGGTVSGTLKDQVAFSKYLKRYREEARVQSSRVEEEEAGCDDDDTRAHLPMDERGNSNNNTDAMKTMASAGAGGTGNVSLTLGNSNSRSIVESKDSPGPKGWLALCKLYEENFKGEGVTQKEFLQSKESGTLVSGERKDQVSFSKYLKCYRGKTTAQAEEGETPLDKEQAHKNNKRAQNGVCRDSGPAQKKARSLSVSESPSQIHTASPSRFRVSDSVLAMDNNNPSKMRLTFYAAVVLKVAHRGGKWWYYVHYRGWKKKNDGWVEEAQMTPMPILAEEDYNDPFQMDTGVVRVRPKPQRFPPVESTGSSTMPEASSSLDQLQVEVSKLRRQKAELQLQNAQVRRQLEETQQREHLQNNSSDCKKLLMHQFKKLRWEIKNLQNENARFADRIKELGGAVPSSSVTDVDEDVRSLANDKGIGGGTKSSNAANENENEKPPESGNAKMGKEALLASQTSGTKNDKGPCNPHDKVFREKVDAGNKTNEKPRGTLGNGKSKGRENNRSATHATRETSTATNCVETTKKSVVSGRGRGGESPGDQAFSRNDDSLHAHISNPIPEKTLKPPPRQQDGQVPRETNEDQNNQSAVAASTVAGHPKEGVGADQDRAREATVKNHDNNLVVVNQTNINDVLCGRNASANHPGNTQFYALVHRVISENHSSSSSSALAAQIVAEIRAKNPPGRFLAKRRHTNTREQDNNGAGWLEMSLSRALEKTAKAIENTIKVRTSHEQETKAAAGAGSSRCDDDQQSQRPTPPQSQQLQNSSNSDRGESVAGDRTETTIPNAHGGAALLF